MLASLLLATALCVAPAARAAEVTDLSPPLRGAAALRYAGAGDAASLDEAGVEVGRRRHLAHTLSLDLEFSPVRGVALAVELPVVLTERLTWSSATEMAYDPTQAAGSMLGSPALVPLPAESGGGLAGPLLALRLAPFHDTLYPGRASRTAWVLEVGYRLQDKSSFYTEREDGTRGGGTGADALHLSTAWSTTRRTARPYLQATLERALTVPTALRAEDGAVLVQEAMVRPASEAAVRVGAELPIVRRDAVEVALDLRSTAGYRTWADLPSGIFLPDVLDASRAVLVNQGESVWIMGELGVLVRVTDLVDVRLGGGAGTETPYTVEHPYAITTAPGVLRWAADAQVKLWIDDRLLQGAGD